MDAKVKQEQNDRPLRSRKIANRQTSSTDLRQNYRWTFCRRYYRAVTKASNYLHPRATAGAFVFATWSFRLFFFISPYFSHFFFFHQSCWRTGCSEAITDRGEGERSPVRLCCLSYRCYSLSIHLVTTLCVWVTRDYSWLRPSFSFPFTKKNTVIFPLPLLLLFRTLFLTFRFHGASSRRMRDFSTRTRRDPEALVRSLRIGRREPT